MLALVPLDNRPCNVGFPVEIGALGGSELLVPPDASLGYFSSPGSSVEIQEWLMALPAVEALIVSVDMLAYGGLVASRRPRVGVEEARERLDVLRRWRAQRPGTPVYAFNVLMRLAITLDADAAAANYNNIMRYARLADEAERFQSGYLRDELRKVEAQIPPAVLHEYLEARARNHAINLHMVDWLAAGIFDYLLITQEDASEYGLHRREQDELLEQVAARGVDDRFSLHPGADEAALTLLARHWDTGVRFRVHWSSIEDAGRVAPFEDRPYRQALEQHIAAMHGIMVLDDAEADFELFVNAPVGGSQKDEDDPARTARAARLTPFLRDLVAAVEAGKRVAVCDVAFPNGADNLLMTELEQRGVLGRLAAYGGWNTAGNTTGTVLAQCAALQHSGNLGAANRRFVFERLVDDWFYQSRVRARVEKAARDMGLSPLNMGEAAAPIEALTLRELRGMAQLLARRHFGAHLANCEVTLPWHRTFEVAVHADIV